MQADIFFFITTIAVVVVAALLTIALVYGIGILRDARKIVKAVKEESEHVLRDVEDVRGFLRREGVKLGAFAGLIGRFFRGNSSARPGRRTKARKAGQASESEDEEVGN